MAQEQIQRLPTRQALIIDKYKFSIDLFSTSTKGVQKPNTTFKENITVQ